MTEVKLTSRSPEAMAAYKQGYLAGIDMFFKAVEKAGVELAEQIAVLMSIVPPKVERTLPDLDDLAVLGFRLMNYPEDMWPPATGTFLYLCAPDLQRTRTDRSKTVLVPIMKVPVPINDGKVIRDRIKYHNERLNPIYGRKL